MILTGLFLIVLAVAFVLQQFGVGGEKLFDVVWPVLVALIGVGFIQEAMRRKHWKQAERARLEKELRQQRSDTTPSSNDKPSAKHNNNDGFHSSTS